MSRKTSLGLFRRGNFDVHKYEYEVTLMCASFPMFPTANDNGSSFHVEWKRGKRHSGSSNKATQQGTQVFWDHTFLLRASIYRTKDGESLEKVLSFAVKYEDSKKKVKDAGVCSVDLSLFTSLSITREDQELLLPLISKQAIFNDAYIQLRLKCHMAIGHGAGSSRSSGSLYSLSTPPPPWSRPVDFPDFSGTSPSSGSFMPSGSASAPHMPTYSNSNSGGGSGSGSALSGSVPANDPSLVIVGNLRNALAQKDEEIALLRLELERLHGGEKLAKDIRKSVSSSDKPKTPVREVEDRDKDRVIAQLQRECSALKDELAHYQSDDMPATANGSPADSHKLEDLQKQFEELKEHYFGSILLAVKMAAPGSVHCNKNEPELFAQACAENVDWHRYSRWVMNQIR